MGASVDHRPAAPADLTALADLAGELASTFVALSSDIALVVDPGGAVRQVVQGDAVIAPGGGTWVGRPWTDTVTLDSRGKIEQVLHDVSVSGVSRAREVNLQGDGGVGIPVSVAAIRLGRDGPLLAVGRDLRAIAAIQQRFQQTQQELERDYWKRRQAESRYRLLFQVATDAVMVVDALSMQIVEANRAAVQLFDPGAATLAGRHAAMGIDALSWPAVEELLNAARATGRAAEIHARAAAGTRIDVSATPFRSDRDLLLLVRARIPHETNADGAEPWADLVQRTPDAVVVTDSGGRITMANPAFHALIEVTGDIQADRRELARWVGDASTMAALIGRVQRHGIATQVEASLHGEQGRRLRVGISAVLLDDGDHSAIGFTMRALDAREAEALPAAEEIAMSIEALGSLMGRRSLPELLNAANALVERHLIRSALQRCGGDESEAAVLLGVAPDALAERMSLHAIGADGGSHVN